MQKFEWPLLQSCVDDKLLEPIDFLFAERMLYCARSDLVNLDSARQSQIEAKCSDRRSLSPSGKGKDEDRFGKVAASPNSPNLTEGSITLSHSSREDVGALLALMMARYREGHVCIELKQEEVSPLRELAMQGQHHIPESLCQHMNGDERMPIKPICRHGDRFYFQKSWMFETQFLQHYVRLMKGTIQIVSVDPIPELNSEQNQAVRLGLTSPISLITGGPGTGKTFTAKHLVKASLQSLSPEQRKKCRIMIAAPTGKAVAHLEKQILSVLEKEEQHILRSGTLHALLQLREDGSQKTAVALFADLIIVDESSMIDAKMGALLLAAIPEGTRLVLIGDRNQLPAVETGCFFADLIDADCPSTVLQQSRRVANQELAALSASMCEGKVNEVREQFTPFLTSETQIDQPQAPFFYVSPPDPDTLLATIDQCQMLSCLRQGPLGVDAINRSMLQRLHGQLPKEDGWWAIPIIIARNDYSSQLYNGDTGILIKKVDATTQMLRMGREDYALFKGREPIAGLALPSFEYAYCLSVHKAQGSEYETVILIVPEGSERFGREVLYTGVTRARQTLKVYGKLGTIEAMLQKSSRKRSGLCERLKCVGLECSALS